MPQLKKRRQTLTSDSDSTSSENDQPVCDLYESRLKPISIEDLKSTPKQEDDAVRPLSKSTFYVSAFKAGSTLAKLAGDQQYYPIFRESGELFPPGCGMTTLAAIKMTGKSCEQILEKADLLLTHRHMWR